MRDPVDDVSEGRPGRTRTGWTDHGGQVVGGSEEERVTRLICVWGSALAIAYPRIACSTALLSVLLVASLLSTLYSTPDRASTIQNTSNFPCFLLTAQAVRPSHPQIDQQHVWTTLPLVQHPNTQRRIHVPSLSRRCDLVPRLAP